jgi:hypothetical protein
MTAPQTATPATLIARAMDMADIPQTSAWVDSTYMLAHCNAALGELQDLIVQANCDYLTIQASPIACTPNVATVALPDDFYKERYVYLFEPGGTTRRKLALFQMQDLEGYDTSNTSGTRPWRYRLRGSFLYLNPVPQVAHTIELWYIPQFANLATLATVISPHIQPSWEEFVVTRLAANLAAREESDPSYYMQLNAQCRERIIEMVMQRNQSDSVTNVDSSKRYEMRVLRSMWPGYPWRSW